MQILAWPLLNHISLSPGFFTCRISASEQFWEAPRPLENLWGERLSSAPQGLRTTCNMLGSRARQGFWSLERSLCVSSSDLSKIPQTSLSHANPPPPPHCTHKETKAQSGSQLSWAARRGVQRHWAPRPRSLLHLLLHSNNSGVCHLLNAY